VARFRTLKNSFLGGELSPKVDGRVDLPQYLQGARDLKNMLPMPEGGTTRRPGSQYISDMAVTTSYRTVPFVFSESDALTVYLQTNGAFTAHATDLLNPGNSGTQRDAVSCTGTIPMYTAAQLKEVHYAQSGDVLVLVHEDHPPTLIIRQADGSLIAYQWDALVLGAPIPYSCFPYQTVPYRDRNANTALTITPSAVTLAASITLTASSALFNLLHVGSYFRISTGTNEGVVKVTAFTSSTVVTATVVSTLPGTTAMSNWAESALSLYRGWPRAVAFFDGRLIFATHETIYGSQIGDLYEFMQKRLDGSTNYNTTDANGILTNQTFKNGIRNDDPFSFTPSSSRASYIQWLAPRETLVAGTSGNELIITGPNEGLSLGPLGISVIPISNYGSSHVQPALIGDRVIFVGRDGRTVRAFGQKENTDSKTAPDLSLLADHITRQDDQTPGRILQLEYQESENILWGVTDQGRLVSCTYEPEINMMAWAHHELGGNWNDGSDDRDPFVFSIAVTPSDDGRHDDLWITTKRTLESTERFVFEVIGTQYEYGALDSEDGINLESPFFLDMAFCLTRVSASTSITGLTWIEGEEVSVFADGRYVGEHTVTAGAITLAVAATTIMVGFRYTSRVIPSRIEAGSQIGSSQGAIKRVDEVSIRFYRTAAAQYGPSTSNLKDITFRPASVSASAAIPLYTGDKKIEWPGDYDENPDIVIETSAPHPMTITAIMCRGITSDA
jgi:hypothetical protein